MKFALTSLQRTLILFMAGGLLGWVFSPYNYWAASLLLFPLWLALLAPLKGRAAFKAGWVFGFGYFLTGLYWVTWALFTDISVFWWVLPIALAVLPAGLAVLFGAAAYATQRWGGQGLGRVIFFAAAFSACEWVRGHMFTGFPWLLLGNLWVDVPLVRDLAAMGGIYLLTLWAVLFASLPVLFFGPQRNKALFLMVGLLGVAAGVHHWVSAQPLEEGPIISLRLVQPSVPQIYKLDPASREANLEKILGLTRQPATTPIDAVIWPEAATGYRLAERDDIRARIAASLPPRSLLITGAVRAQPLPNDDVSYHNSVQVMDRQTALLGAYDKQHLVPFGEFIPLRWLIPFEAVASGRDYTPGDAPQTLALPGLPPFSPLVCYDVIFPGTAARHDAPAPRWMVNVTNDGWYGPTHGPHQHLDIARIRSIEEGMPLVRVANSGVSAIVDARGSIVTSIPLDAVRVLDYRLPIKTWVTPFVRWGHGPFWLMLAGLLFTSAIFRFKQR